MKHALRHSAMEPPHAEGNPQFLQQVIFTFLWTACVPCPILDRLNDCTFGNFILSDHIYLKNTFPEVAQIVGFRESEIYFYICSKFEPIFCVFVK